MDIRFDNQPRVVAAVYKYVRGNYQNYFLRRVKMNGTKNWWQSKTMWAGIVTLVIGVLGSTGLSDMEGQQDVIVEKIMEILTAIGSLIVLYGRATAQSAITKKPPASTAGVLLLCAMLIAGGCSQVQMSPQYRQQLLMSNALVQSLNGDCQAGDPNACRDGLNESAKTLQKLVDAVDVRVLKGGDGR